MNTLLHELVSEVFELEVGFLPPTRALRRRLQRIRRVKSITKAIRLGVISETDVRSFTEDVALNFQAGVVLHGEVALAALAVALETCPQDFAEEYLCDLARLKVSELGLAIRVAQECLTARLAQPKNAIRQFSFPVRGRRSSAEIRVVSRSTVPTALREARTAKYTPVGA